MKRKYGDRADWRRVVERRYAQAYLETENFKGHVTLLELGKVTEPLWVDYAGTKVCIANDGYTWLQQFPIGLHHAVTTMFDEKGQIVQWYVDICYRNGISAENVPWMDDLFVDIVVLPSGEVVHKDADELEDALASGMIDRSLYLLAKAEEERLHALIENGSFQLLGLAAAHRERLHKKLQ
ncbi:DUF402 domain-containing protein [Paenibacillus rhizovicinus]|uniref:DUF402 domain-containing protein n=1 Tax=Paenibacillus rhizovicinus TaxID=2704463 RepID=UPI00298C16D8|nr:DUF402 domain-containing protein [Paenibacillus rhizovicinus]